MAKGWHITVDGAALTLARRLPARFDIEARGHLPDGNRAAYAHQIRQDLWRKLRHVRGFSPVVELLREEEGLRVRAGGRLDGPAARTCLNAQVAALLADPALRTRWIAHA